MTLQEFNQKIKEDTEFAKEAERYNDEHGFIKLLEHYGVDTAALQKAGGMAVLKEDK